MLTERVRKSNIKENEVTEKIIGTLETFFLLGMDSMAYLATFCINKGHSLKKIVSLF